MPQGDKFEILQVNTTALTASSSATLRMDIGFSGYLIALTNWSTGDYTLELKSSDNRIVIPAESHNDAILGTAQRPFWLPPPGFRVSATSSLTFSVLDISASENNIYINGIFNRLS